MKGNIWNENKKFSPLGEVSMLVCHEGFLSLSLNLMTYYFYLLVDLFHQFWLFMADFVSLSSSLAAEISLIRFDLGSASALLVVS